MRRRDAGAPAPPLEIVLDVVQVEAGADAAVVGRAVEARVRAELAARGLASGDGVSRAVSAALVRAGYPDSRAGSPRPPGGSRP